MIYPIVVYGNAVLKKQAEQPLDSKTVIQPNQTSLKKKEATTSFRSYFPNYSTGMRV